jgi:two-component system, NarL family, nitrate/nitrite response regulator NarL
MPNSHTQHNPTQTDARAMRLLLVVDHALFRVGLQELLERRGIEVTAAVADWQQGIELAVSEHPDAVLLDLQLPGMSEVEVLRELRKSRPNLPVAMLTFNLDEESMIKALRAGATGYLLRSIEPDELITSLQNMIAGHLVVAKQFTQVLSRAMSGELDISKDRVALAGLTPREMEILCHLAAGMSNKMIARELGITEGTVKLHVKAILRKLQVNSRVDAAVIAVEEKLCARGPGASV